MKRNPISPALTEFFDRTSHEADDCAHPIWLLSDYDASKWRIDTRQGDIRRVNGRVKGGALLVWSTLFPLGKFTHKVYAIPLRQCKALVVSAVTSPSMRPTSLLVAAVSWHRYLMWFSEHLAVKYGRAFAKLGLAVANGDDVEDFLEAIETSGVGGAVMLVDRWQHYVEAQCLKQGKNRQAQETVLANLGAYDEHGRLKTAFVAKAINVDSARLRKNTSMKRYLYACDQAHDLSAITVEEAVSGRAANAARWAVSLSKVLRDSGGELAECELANVTDVAKRCKPYQTPSLGRTKTLPITAGRRLVEGCCTWMTSCAPGLEAYVGEVVSTATSMRSVAKKSRPIHDLLIAERMVSVPEGLARIDWSGLKSGRYSPVVLSGNARSYPGILCIVQLHVSICYALIALLSCSRRNEIVELERGAVRVYRGRHYLKVALRKREVGGVRISMEKPVPKLVKECEESLARIEANLEQLLGRPDPLSSRRMFFKANNRGIWPLTHNDLKPSLSSLSDFLHLCDLRGNRWELKSHQLRRHFAMSFFHSGGAENVLPALTWFMGHEDISATWRYIREELTGRELSEAEASMATAAIFSDDQSQAVQRLRNIVLKHFGHEDLTIMDEVEAQHYLEILAEKGLFTAQPIQISGSGRKSYTILISIKEKLLHGQTD